MALGHTGAVRLGDAHIVSRFDGDDLTRARLNITLPLENLGASAHSATIELELIDLSGRQASRSFTLDVTLAPGARRLRKLVRLDGSLCAEGTVTLSLAANSVGAPVDVGIAGRLATEGVLLARLQLRAADGTRLSRNLYWLARAPSEQRALCALAQVELSLTLDAVENSPAACLVTLANRSAVPSLHDKLTLLDGAGKRVLPAYYSDNYLSPLPGEAIQVRIEGAGAAAVALRGWNRAAQTLVLNQECA